MGEPKRLNQLEYLGAEGRIILILISESVDWIKLAQDIINMRVPQNQRINCYTY